ncbi:MAG TPA: ATP-binding protein [Bacteroidetes bacterium]|nr:ATP-binding protein [Bacteroidota bacterium]
MIDKIINNKGGLHNRITGKIKLEPFKLYEVEQFFISKNILLDRYQIVLLYMVFGGIPFYLEQIKKGLSANQNINELCFQQNALFRNEYQNLYKSLFKKSDNHIKIVEVLSKKKKGLTRNEIVKFSGLANGGSLTRILTELEQSSFIKRYSYLDKKQKGSLYQLIDMYSLFYLNFIKKSSPDDENFWINAIDSPIFHSWSGYSYEMVCLHHIKQIKVALGISGIQSSVASWHSDKAQIDLLIDRKDNVINICEIKFSLYPYSIDKSYSRKLINKIADFKEKTKTRKAIFLTMITTYGLKHNKYSGMVQNNITMESLFNKEIM